MKPDLFLANHSLFTREELSVALAGRSPRIVKKLERTATSLTISS